MIELGVAPESLAVHLAPGADFYCVLYLADGTDWPAGSSPKLSFEDGTTWTPTVAGADAIFNVDKAVVDPVRDQMGVKLLYTNGATDQVWAIGKVVRHG